LLRLGRTAVFNVCSDMIVDHPVAFSHS